MKIAVVGAGFLGLSTAWQLLKKGHQVTIFEKEQQPGGLAIGFRVGKWDWALEKHYHHIFESDLHIQKLADEIGHRYTFYDAKTYSLLETGRELEYWRLDSPLTLLQFAKLSFMDRIRTGLVIGFLRYVANWRSLEKYTAAAWLRKWNGLPAYTLLWKPLFEGKFGNRVEEVNLAWFWSRIKARSQKLGYFDEGFLGLAQAFLQKIREAGATVKMNYEIKDMSELTKKYDRVIIAGATNLVKHKIEYVGTINVILRLKKEFLPKGIYWLNNLTANSPILAIIEHTHLIDRAHYNNEHLVYVAKYLAHDHKFMTISDAALLKEYTPLLNRINPAWKKNLIGFTVHRAKYTQPVMPINYSQYIPNFATDNPKVFVAGMQQVYPWDRGTNFAIELGEKLANLF